MIKVGSTQEREKRINWWEDVHISYTGYNSKPFKVDEDNY